MIPDDFNAIVLNVIGFEDTPRGLKALLTQDIISNTTKQTTKFKSI